MPENEKPPARRVDVYLYVKIICYKNVSYFQPIFLIPAKTDYIIGCKSDTNIDEKDR